MKILLASILVALPGLPFAAATIGLLDAPAIGPPAARAQWPDAAPSRGVVVDEAGLPLAGVRYWVSGNEERVEGTWRVVHFTGMARMSFTGADGRFEVPGREGLRSDVDFDASGFSPTFVLELEPGEEARVVMELGHDLRGRVTQRRPDGERAVEHAKISIRRPNGRGLWFETDVLSDETGAFVFPGFLPRSTPRGEAQPTADPGWELVCAGATLALPGRVERAIDDVEIELAILRGE